MHEAVKVSPEEPVLLDRFLDDAVEMDVDAVCDGDVVAVAGVMEHIEQAGVHSGDSACSLPPYSLAPSLVAEIRRQTREMAKALKVVGLMNVQFAVKDAHTENPVVYVLEVNPRASRTVPFVSKATGHQLAKIAVRCMVGDKLVDQGLTVEELEKAPPYFSVKEAVFPFAKFQGVDPVLGPEMRSTGEVMGIGRDFGEALRKSQLVIMSVAEHENELDDARAIRQTCLAEQTTYYTTMAGGLAAAEGIRHGELSEKVRDLQSLHQGKVD